MIFDFKCPDIWAEREIHFYERLIRICHQELKELCKSKKKGIVVSGKQYNNTSWYFLEKNPFSLKIGLNLYGVKIDGMCTVVHNVHCPAYLYIMTKLFYRFNKKQAHKWSNTRTSKFFEGKVAWQRTLMIYSFIIDTGFIKCATTPLLGRAPMKKRLFRGHVPYQGRGRPPRAKKVDFLQSKF